MFSHTIFIYCKPPLTVVPLTISTFPLYSTPALVSCSVSRLLSPLPHAVAHCMLPLSPLEPPPKADMDPRGRPSALWTPTASSLVASWCRFDGALAQSWCLSVSSGADLFGGVAPNGPYAVGSGGGIPICCIPGGVLGGVGWAARVAVV